MFWERFYQLCLAKGTKPLPVVKELSIATGSITKWKNGTVPNGSTLKKIADYFDVTVDYLIGNTDNPHVLTGHNAIMSLFAGKTAYDEYKEFEKSLELSHEELLVLYRYRSVSEEARLIIRKILDIPNGDEELVPVYHAAHSKDGTAEDRIIYRTREEIDRLENAPESDIDI